MLQVESRFLKGLSNQMEMLPKGFRNKSVEENR